jgi:hypothetical protein
MGGGGSPGSLTRGGAGEGVPSVGAEVELLAGCSKAEHWRYSKLRTLSYRFRFW